jgi:hypothetical protein
MLLISVISSQVLILHRIPSCSTHKPTYAFIIRQLLCLSTLSAGTESHTLFLYFHILNHNCGYIVNTHNKFTITTYFHCYPVVFIEWLQVPTSVLNTFICFTSFNPEIFSDSTIARWWNWGSVTLWHWVTFSMSLKHKMVMRGFRSECRNL